MNNYPWIWILHRDERLLLSFQSSAFTGFIMLVILLNALTIGLETNEEWKVNYGNVFKALDEFFLAIYTMEFFLKLYAEPKGYWKSSYNIFDVTILGISYVQLIMDEMNVGDNVLAPLRLLRGECYCVPTIFELCVLLGTGLHAQHRWVVSIVLPSW